MIKNNLRKGQYELCLYGPRGVTTSFTTKSKFENHINEYTLISKKFSDYKYLFELLFGINNFPLLFSYKAAIILEKKEFLN